MTTLAATAPAAEPAAGRRPVDPGQLVYMIEYVGSDYPRAVKDGKIINDAEYGEVLRMTREVIKEYRPPGGKPDDVSTNLARIEKFILDRGPEIEVWNTTRVVLPELARNLGAVARPKVAPNLANGRHLYEEDCASCHGESGAGDGPSAAGLDPPPMAFREQYLERLSPRQVFNAVTFGIDATAMPSYVPAYTEEQRWDVASYVVTLGAEFAPQRPPAGLRISLEDLSTLSGAELLDRLRQTYPDANPRWVDYLRLNVASVVIGAGKDTNSSASGGLGVAMQLQDAFAAVAEQVFPSVVGIGSYKRGSAPEAGKQGSWTAPPPGSTSFPGFHQLHSGSGFLVDPDQGYVLTCDHHLRDDQGNLAEFTSIETQDQHSYVARIVGAEPTLDLAVLQLVDPAWKSPPAELTFGDSDRLQIGHWLLALGDPPGAERNLAVGVVAAAAQRQCYQEEFSATLVQSSLSIAPRAIGGPVVDIQGNVIGMSILRPQPAPPSGSTAGSRPSATANNGVATTSAASILPINLLLNLLETLKVSQSNRSPWLGISVLELPRLQQQLAERGQTMAVPESGVFIDNVFDPSPASRAGVRTGDFLLSLSGHKITSVADFQRWLYITGIDTKAELQLHRDGKPLKLTVPIEERPANATTR